jgi:crossover junction endodeoxyribonuclease RusA
MGDGAVSVPDLRVWVPGAPAPQGSKRHVGRGILVESSKALGPWRDRVAMFATASNPSLLTGPVRVDADFVMTRPVSTPKRRTPAAVKRPDLDKLLRGVLDALTGVTWADDSQVVEVFATKRLAAIGETPGLRLVVMDLTERDEIKDVA